MSFVVFKLKELFPSSQDSHRMVFNSSIEAQRPHTHMLMMGGSKDVFGSEILVKGIFLGL